VGEQTSDFGYGHQDPTDSTDDFNVICAVVQSLIYRLDTMKLVKVVAVTGGGVGNPPGTVDVMPLVNQIDGAGNAQPHGTVHGIPWTRLQGGKNAFVLDPLVDDIGWVACGDRDGSVVKETSKQANPGSSRSYSISDGVYVGGLLGVAPEQYIAILDGVGLDLKDKFGNRIQTVDDASSIAITSKGDVLIDANGANGNLAVMGGGSFSGGLEAQTFNVANGSGTVTRILTGTITPAFGTPVPAGTTFAATATVTGAKVGDMVFIARPANGAPAPLLNMYGYVSSANVVTMIIANSLQSSVIPVVAATYNILVIGLTP
jgi:hypothetical protein